MSKIRVKNFGPISDGFSENDGFIDLNKIIVFIGSQGAGKSAIAKLIATFCWLEKALVRGDFSTVSSEEFRNNYLAYHCIDSYLREDSFIEYRGSAFNFICNGFNFKIQKNHSDVLRYEKPKVTYIPAERNLISTLRNPVATKGLPKNLFELLDDFYEARKLFIKQYFDLPLKQFKYRFDEKTGNSYVSNSQNSFETELYEAASGLQSIVPLALVTQYNSELISSEKDSGKWEKYSFDELKKAKQLFDAQIKLLDSEILQQQFFAYMSQNNPWLYNFYLTNGFLKRNEKMNLQKKYAEKEKNILSALEYGIYSLIDCRTVTIVEEPEQNLFPESQADILYHLLRCVNSDNKLKSQNTCNSLIITTHSPYIVEALNNSIYAKRLKESGKNIKDLLQDSELVAYDDVLAFKVYDGKIESIKDDSLKQIDVTYLDSCSERIRTLYGALEDIEYGIL